jgi:hypothetical protein
LRNDKNMSEHQSTTQAEASAKWRLGLATRLREIRNELSQVRELLAVLAAQRPERQQEHRNGTARDPG